MIDGIIKTVKLELTHFKENGKSAFIFFLAPIIVILIFSMVGNQSVSGQTYYDLRAPGIFMFLLLFVTVELTVLRIIGEKAPYGTLDRELLAISRTEMYLGKFIANFLVSFGVFVLITLVGIGILQAENKGDYAVILFLFALMSSFGLSIGLLISVFAKTKEQATSQVPFVVLTLLVMSGLFISTRNMSGNVVDIVEKTPFQLGYSALEKVMHEGDSLMDVGQKVFGMMVWVGGVFALGLYKFNKDN
jgi:ABC-2 type transport system permease protein